MKIFCIIIRYDTPEKDSNAGDPYLVQTQLDEYPDDYFFFNNQIESLKNQLDSKEVVNALSNQSVSKYSLLLQLLSDLRNSIIDKLHDMTFYDALLTNSMTHYEKYFCYRHFCLNIYRSIWQ